MSRRSSFPGSLRAWGILLVALLGGIGAFGLTDAQWRRLGREIFGPPPRAERAATPREPFSGQPRVIDGDTLDVAGIRVRMQGIDAFEHDQQCSRAGGGRFACGAAARAELAGLIGSRAVTCTPDGSLTHGRTVATCTVPGRGGAMDLNAAMVRSGLAFDCPRYSDGRYARDEAAAKSDNAGAWGGRFTYPWSHRDRANACGRR
ncbi:thermonuclease family protein [Roseomonas sp. 18066]|uniref:thermonuclease family protein n=1 Tax=Roseomonas sp. 18066 TaxID=2681412 RepID=UPI001F2D7FA5|nr:thermonuclease family protein [Roseomonas sp. 18066]